MSWVTVGFNPNPLYANVHLAAKGLELGPLFSVVGSRLGRAVAGGRWLSKHFPETPACALWLRLVDAPRPAVIGFEVDRESAAVAVRLDCPASWFQTPLDGRLAVRLLAAGLSALVELGLGSPPMRAPGRDPGGADDAYLFGRDEPTTLADTRELTDLFHARPADSGVLYAPFADGEVRRRQDAVARRLGAQDRRTHPDLEVVSWTLPTLPS